MKLTMSEVAKREDVSINSVRYWLDRGCLKSLEEEDYEVFRRRRHELLDSNKYLTIKEVAELEDINPHTLYNRIKKGYLKGIRVSRVKLMNNNITYLIKKSDYEEYAKKYGVDHLLADCLTLHDMSKMVGYSPTWLGKMIARGKLKAFRGPSNEWEVDREEVNRFIKEEMNIGEEKING